MAILERNPHRWIFTCGGTAGHVNPAIAWRSCWESGIQRRNFCLWERSGDWKRTWCPRRGNPFETVHISSFHRSMRPAEIRHNLVSAANLVRAPHEARAILKEFQPRAVIGTGGYASYPLVKAAAQAGIPTAVHESNMVPGLTTKMLEPYADRVMVGLRPAGHFTATRRR